MTDGAKEGEQKLNLDEQQKEIKATDDGGKELEALKKELATRDKKIQELLQADKARQEETEKQRLASLTADEKLKELEARLEKNDKITRLVANGFTSEQALEISNCTDDVEKATLIAKFSATKAVENFKLEALAKVPPEAKPQQDNLQDDAFTKGMKRGLSA